MATNILASGTTTASSADQTLADGAANTLIMIGEGRIEIEAKTVAGYRSFGALTTDSPVVNIAGPIIYRVTRNACPVALAVDRE
jgi:hypothetical protein